MTNIRKLFRTHKINAKKVAYFFKKICKMLNIKKLRAEKNISQTTLSSELKVSLRTIQNYESGRVNIPSDKMKLMARFFNVPIDELYDGNGHVENNKASNPLILSEESLNSIVEKVIDRLSPYLVKIDFIKAELIDQAIRRNIKSRKEQD